MKRAYLIAGALAAGAAVITFAVVRPFTSAAAPPFKATAPARSAALDSSSHPRLQIGTSFRHLRVDDRDRSYIVHVPRSYDPAKPTPLVLVFHGAHTNARIVELYSGLDRKSESAGFIVAYPNGTGESPSSLFFNVAFPAGEDGWPDDVNFTSKIIDDLESAANIDPKRVYATGISNGGMMCYTLAAKLSSRIAAIAPISGVVTLEESHPARPVSVIHFHGTADTYVPFDGPTPDMAQYPKSVDASVKLWAKIDGCPETPEVTDLPDKAHDGTLVHRRIYGPGKDGAEVVLYVIDNGGHTWPNRRGAVRILGKSTRNIDANDLMWEFFCNHPMK